MNNDDFFRKLKQIEAVVVIGHSLGEVDIPYYQKIHMSRKNAMWYIGYHEEYSREYYREKMLSIGICQGNLVIVPNYELLSYTSAVNSEIDTIIDRERGVRTLF